MELDTRRSAIGLPAEPWRRAFRHLEEQDQERETAGQLRREGGYVFTTPTGEPINPNTPGTRLRAVLLVLGSRSGR